MRDSPSWFGPPRKSNVHPLQPSSQTTEHGWDRFGSPVPAHRLAAAICRAAGPRQMPLDQQEPIVPGGLEQSAPLRSSLLQARQRVVADRQWEDRDHGRPSGQGPQIAGDPVRGSRTSLDLNRAPYHTADKRTLMETVDLIRKEK